MAAIVLVVLVLFGNGSTYTLKANFLDAGGLVTGDDVLIGPARVGSVSPGAVLHTIFARVNCCDRSVGGASLRRLFTSTDWVEVSTRGATKEIGF